MKKNKLGITGGEVSFTHSKEKDFISIHQHGYDIASDDDNVDGLTSIAGIWENIDKTDIANAALIADAFNTANKCGLLPSELLEQNTLLLEALIQIRTVGGLYLDGKLSKIIRDTINQIEQ